MFELLSSILIGATALIGGFFSPDPTLGALPPLQSAQLAAGADNGDCLTTDGTSNVWSSSCSGGSGSSFAYLFPNNATTTGLGLYASTTIGAGNAATGLTVNGTATSTRSHITARGSIPAPSLSIQNTSSGLAAGTSNELYLVGNGSGLNWDGTAFAPVDNNAKNLGVDSTNVWNRIYVNHASTTALSASNINASLFITAGGDSDDWNTAFGWGNHASAGYATFAYPFPLAATSTTLAFTGGLLSTASSTIHASTTITGALTASGGVYGNLTGNAGTASALAANGSNCSAGSAAGGVNASGAAEDCTDYWTEAENTSAAYIALTGLSATWPITYNNGTGAFTWSGLATTSQGTAGQLYYSNGSTGLIPVSTSSVTISSPLTSAGTAGYVVGGSGWTIDIDDIKAADLDLTDITLNDFTNDAGFTTFAYPFPSNATTTLLTFSGGASTTNFSANTLAVGGSATTSISAAGNLVVGGTLTAPSSFGGNGVIVNGTALDFDCSDVTDSGANDGIGCSTEDLVVSIDNDNWDSTDLSVANGGTGLSTFGGSNTILYTSSADTLTSEAAFTYNASTNLLTTSYASTTALSATTLCISTDCRTAWPAGGSGSSPFATTTVYGTQELIYPTSNNQDFALGKSSTTTAPFWWDVSATTTYIGNGGTGDSDFVFGPTSYEWTLGFDDTDDSFAIASSTALGTSNALTINKSTLQTTLSSLALTTDLAVTHGGTGLSTFGGTNTLLYTTSADTLSSEAALTYDASLNKLTTSYASTTGLSVGTDFITDFSTGLSISAGGVVTVTDVTCTDCLNATEIEDIYLLNSGDTGTGTYDLSGATVKVHTYPAFSYSTSTTFTGTTTIPLGPAYTAESWSGAKCFTDTGTVQVSFYDGTNRMNWINASTTVGTNTLSTNNTFTAGEKRYVDLGTPASSPTKVSCTVDRIVNN